ncbi:MAG TPA: glycerol-3-phosphate dehydrogenase/oxidase [Thermodesulfobacteriota bacterium]|nr:glycerol-3-phosphate dehydrogenase/oxidase [Thermodesulfobacteriota bacterium]
MAGRHEAAPHLEGEVFDVVVIGGGIHGAGVARDAALRGYRTLLVEKEDFGCGTTSRSSKLAHGGLRYLEHLEFGLVREALAERGNLWRMAPHLVRPLEFLLPVYEGDRYPLWMVGLGVRLYGRLADDRERRYGILDAAETLRREPALSPRGLKGGVHYLDGQIVSPERLCLEVVLSAREAGATVVNHTAVEGVHLTAHEPAVVDVRHAPSGRTQSVRGRVVVNATGPWVDRVRRLAGLGGPPTLRLTKGVHLVVPRVSRQALYLSTRADGRMFFVLPWKDYSLIGTTDTDFDGDPGRLAATDEEVDYLLGAARRVLPGARLTPGDILYTYAGVRPLAAGRPTPRGRWLRVLGRPAGRAPGAASRRAVVHAEGPGGTFLSITGGKLTTYRRLAETVVDRIERLLGPRQPCRTGQIPLHGGVIPSLARALADAPEFSQRYGVDRAAAAVVIETYGSRAAEVLRPLTAQPWLSQRLCSRSPDLLVQILHAVDRELAVTLSDILLRRLAAGTGPCQGRDCAPRAAEVMGKLVGWDAARQAREVAAYLAETESAQPPRSRAAAG